MLSITPAERAILRTRLADAEKQYHLLATGRQGRVFVDSNGERIEFTAANRIGLAAYIQELKRQLGMGAVLGPMRTFL